MGILRTLSITFTLPSTNNKSNYNKSLIYNSGSLSSPMKSFDL